MGEEISPTEAIEPATGWRDETVSLGPSFQGKLLAARDKGFDSGEIHYSSGTDLFNREDELASLHVFYENGQPKKIHARYVSQLDVYVTGRALEFILNQEE
jgi:hypothetical protein